jgi:cysteine synthase A
MWGAMCLIAEMRSAGEQGSVVTLICDRGDRYAGTYFDDDWVRAQGLDLDEPTQTLERWLLEA